MEAPAAAAGDLAALVDAVRGAERQLARAVVLAARLTGAERWMIVTAGEVLAGLPVVTRPSSTPPTPS